MIFRPEVAKLIRDGGKTQHRIAIAPGGHACRHQPGQVRRVQPARQRAVADPTRPPRSICRIHITDVTRDLLGNVNDEDAQAEGFPSFDAYLNDWQQLYGLEDWPLDQPVWVLTFEIFTPSTVRQDVPLYLATGVLGGYTEDDDDTADELIDRGYTTNSARALDAGEVLDTYSTTEAFSAHRRWVADRAEVEQDRAAESATQRIERALMSAKAAGIDTTAYEQAIHRRAAAIENRLRKRAA